MCIEPSMLRAGDLVFRRTATLAGLLVHSVDGGEWSHVGVVVARSCTTWGIVHAAPGEPGTQGRARIDTLESFARDASALAVYRVEHAPPDVARGASAMAARMARKGTPFDGEFDLRSDDAMYCTELAWKAYIRCGLDLLDGSRDALPQLRGCREGILPRSLARSRWLTLVEGATSRR